MSTSTDPTATLAGRLTAMLEQERAAIARVPAARLGALVGEGQADAEALTRNWIDGQPAPKRPSKQRACLAEALYFEARGESVTGQFAVAEVILNRVESKRYPDTVCAVVKQGTGARHRCQFSYTCDGLPETMRDRRAHERARKIAQLAMSGQVADLTDGATHYHTRQVAPSWSRVFPRTTTIGAHHFYRETTRLVNR